MVYFKKNQSFINIKENIAFESINLYIFAKLYTKLSYL